MSVEISLKVLALGTSSTGKTCFLYAMADCMRSGCGGFVFESVDEGLRSALENGWESFSNGATPPNSTTRSTTYNFRCVHSNSTVATLSWLDYRGADIIGEPTAEKEEIMRRMREAYFLMIFVGADEILQTAISPEQLRNLPSDERREIVRKVNALNERLACYNKCLEDFRSQNGRTVPVALVVTKGDLLGTVKEFNAAKQFMKEKFSSLFVSNAGWKVALMRCGLSYPQKPWHAGERITQVYNMHLPIVFGLLEGFRELCRRIGEEQQRWQREANAVRSDIQEEEWWWTWLRDKEKLKRLRSHLDEIERTLSNGTQNLEVTKKYVKTLGNAIEVSEETDIYDHGVMVMKKIGGSYSWWFNKIKYSDGCRSSIWVGRS